MKYLDAETVRRCLAMDDAIESMRAAFSRDRQIPQRVQLGSSMFMPGRVGEYTGIKVVSTVPGNPVGLVAIFDMSGVPVGLVDGPTLTAIRTGAGAGLATDLLAASNASSMAMLGAGAMAFDQIAAIRAVRPIESVVVWSRNPDNAQALADIVGGVAVRDADEAVRDADIITTATPASAPLFDHTSLPVQVHINAIGAYTPTMVEIPPAFVRDAFVVVDDYAAAAAEAGDLLTAGREPDIDVADLLESGSRDRGPRTLFKSVGIATQDIAAAAAALANAERLGLGIELDQSSVLPLGGTSEASSEGGA
ncbi:MAG: ornithine cyclodeaminase family protein [Acidimicrobiia bacterium]